MSRANNDDQIFMGRAIIKHGLGFCCRHIHYNIKEMEEWGMKNGPSECQPQDFVEGYLRTSELCNVGLTFGISYLWLCIRMWSLILYCIFWNEDKISQLVAARQCSTVN